MHEDQFLEANGSPVGTRLASGHTGLVQRAGTQWWPPGPNGQRHMNTWMYQSHHLQMKQLELSSGCPV